MTFDYKKEYKEFYMPKGTPSIVRVPKMNYIAVRGSGNPNDADGEYKQSIGLLYGIAFTVNYDPTVVDTMSVQSSFVGSWLGTVGVDMITFVRHFPILSCPRP